ncbi:hypothetical protein I5677_05425 [Mobilitalea sibirica]|uniref:Transposase n=1 Tax=Mobilitalea sibirica TaxID=1462919 RepID=A0A8J7H5S7_9FIRM|nr:hypothetical protein [Mobilitalea sibirica]MBH1940336.1 hypothetical protein [Mobilitalea sibirica]
MNARKSGYECKNWMCKRLGISRIAYYKWLHRKIPEQVLEHLKLAELIEEHDEIFCRMLGYHRMTTWINHFNHTTYSKKRAYEL